LICVRSLGTIEGRGISRVQLANVELHIWEHVISGRIFPGRFLGEIASCLRFPSPGSLNIGNNGSVFTVVLPSIVFLLAIDRFV
jgi:hypothetical protein